MFVVAALYHFTRFDDLEAIRGPLKVLCETAKIHGTLLLAHEGINGTIAGTRQGIDDVLAHVRTLPGCGALEHKESYAQTAPFAHMKVRVKAEIVTMGKADVDPLAAVGTYVEPSEWNALIESPDVVVIDTRNDYETDIGTFKGAVIPNTSSFREFPAWWEANKGRFENKRIAMFCTGGIRCEKSTNWLKTNGVEDVFHLKGGILQYLEDIPQSKSTWSGSCFVFDSRVSVDHGLEEGQHVLCHACRRPILPSDRTRDEYEDGVSCHRCVGETTEADKSRFRERQKQIGLAQQRGKTHLGGFRGTVE